MARYDDWASIPPQLEGAIASGRAAGALTRLVPSTATLSAAAKRDAALAELLAASSVGVVNVMSYGAKGDGSTDDTVAIAAAMTAAANGTLFFPPGNYKLTSTLTITNTIGQLKIFGSGGQGTTTLTKHHTGDLLVVNAGQVEISKLSLEAATSVSVSYGTSGRGVYVANDVSTTPNFRLRDGAILNIDNCLEFAADSGSGAVVSNCRLVPYTITEGAEGRSIYINGPDTSARPRFFSNIATGGGIIELNGAFDAFFQAVFSRRIVHSAADEVCSFIGVRYGNLGNPITLDGGSCSWHGCTFSGDLTIAATANNCQIEGIITNGAVTDLSARGDNIVAIMNGSKMYAGNVHKQDIGEAAVRGDEAVSLGATDARDQVWNVALTTDRNCNLPSTGLYSGLWGTVTRTSAATGASNLNVNANGGLLKALAVGTWCRWTCDGATIYLTGYGAL